jgi:acyl carrier protein
MAAAKLTAEEIENWLTVKLADWLGMDPKTIDPKVPFRDYGLDSVTGLSLIGELEEWLGERLADDVLYQHPAITPLAAYLSQRMTRPQEG